MTKISQSVREKAIAFFNNQPVSQDSLDKNFTDYILAYCHELKKTEWDILLNDKNFELVFSIFQNIYKNQFAVA